MKSILNKIAGLATSLLIIMMLIVMPSCAIERAPTARSIVNNEEADLGGGRGPASGFSKSCDKLDSNELPILHRMVDDMTGVGQSLTELFELAHLFHQDTDIYDVNRLSFANFISREHGLMFRELQTFSRILLGSCSFVRDGESPNAALNRRRHPREFQRARELCGVDDAHVTERERAHPTTPRNWINYESEAEIDLRRWVTTANSLFNPVTGDIMSPHAATEACQRFTFHANVEDRIEHLFLCLDAYVLNLYQYDTTTNRYQFDANRDLQPRAADERRDLNRCLMGILNQTIELAPNGTPREVRGGQQAVAQTQVRAQQAGQASAQVLQARSQSQSPSPSPSPAQAMARVAQSDRAASSSQFAPPLHPGVHPEGVGHEPSRCLPGDSGDGACQTDSCVGNFKSYANSHRVQLPSDLDSNDMRYLYDNEKGRFITEITRHQAKLLGQGYVVTAFQRSWTTPKAYNDNLKEFAASCRNSTIRNELEQALSHEYVNENVVDNSYDPIFATQSTSADDLGHRMVNAVKQIVAVRRLVALLNYDVGGQEISTLKYPRWLGYIPVGSNINRVITLGNRFEIPYVSPFLQGVELPIPLLHYMVGADIGISFGNSAHYQCNALATMSGNDFVARTSNLITNSDREIRRLFNDSSFRSTAFCNSEGRCNYPPMFEHYLHETDLTTFAEADRARVAGGDLSSYNIHLRDWCSMRFYAGQALLGVEQQLLSLYPALAHAETVQGTNGHDDAPGAPLFDRINTMRGSESEKAQFALNEARRVLPQMQQDLKTYLGRICSDYNSSQRDSVFLAALNQQFLAGFDYCSGLSTAERPRAGLSCPHRTDFLACKLQAEANAWKDDQEFPKFLMEVGMTGLDALFVYSVVSGGIANALTPRGMLTGGATGVAFTGATYGLTYWLAQNGQAASNDALRGSAALALDGVDSYTNALTAIAASQPKPRVADFVMGFVIGAAMSGHAEADAVEAGGEGGGRGARPNARTPREVFSSIARRVGDYSESVGDGVRFEPRSLSQLKNWLMQREGESPGFTETLLRHMGEKLLELSDRDYGRLFATEAGHVRLGLVRRAMGVRLSQLSSRLNQILTRIKNDLSFRRMTGERLGGVERFLDQTGIQATDLARAADQMGPREISALADAVDEATREVPGERPPAKMKRLSDFLRKLCGMALWCPGLEGLQGCPL